MLKGLQARRDRAPSGPGKPLSRGRITSSFRMRRDRDAEGVEKGGNVGAHHPTSGLREHRTLPRGVRGGAPADRK